MVAHWENENHTAAGIWEPGWKNSDNWTKDRWTHYAYLFSDKGLPGFDTPTDIKSYSMVNGVRRDGTVVRIGESYKTYVNNNSISNQIHMTGFCTIDRKSVV